MIALSILLKASLVVLAAAGLERLLAGRASAASRHLLWTLAIAASLLLPVFALSLPKWTAVTWEVPATSSAPASSLLPPAGSPASDDSIFLDSGAAQPAASTSPPGLPERLDGVPPSVPEFAVSW